MTRRLFGIGFFVFISCAICYGQTSFKGLTPGKSTKADVERVLGQAVRALSDTLSEYKSDKETEQIFVQYGRDSGVVERIEATYSDTIERSTALRSLKLPSQSTASRTNSKGRLEEYFSTASVVLTYAGPDVSSGVSRIGYYSRELFESAVAKTSGARQNPPPPDASGRSDGLGTREDNTALNGTTLTYYARPNVDQCESDCANNANCKGFTWIKAGTYNPGDAAMCYLLSVVTRKIPARGHTSAVKGRR